MHMDLGEHHRGRFCAFGIEFDDAVLDRFAALFKDIYNISGGAAASSHQY